jgi:hypothetical protein
MLKKFPSLTFVLLLGLPLSAFALEKELDAQTGIDKDAKASQDKIDELDDETSLNLQRYRLTAQRQESLEIYTKQLQKLIDSQVEEITSVERQTKEIDDIETGSLPLMLEMTATLGDIVDADMPFLISDREERVEKLKTLIDRADVTAGEKFRRIMEGYLIEVDFGRTIEAYRGEIETDGVPRTVDFLRLGRIGLYYQTLDGAESGRWNKTSGVWEVLDSRARRQIQIGLRIARKQAPPELLTLPVAAAGEKG